MIEGMENDARELIKSLISLTYFMRGSVSYNDLMWMTYGERELVKEFLDARFETESKNPYPNY